MGKNGGGIGKIKPTFQIPSIQEIAAAGLISITIVISNLFASGKVSCGGDTDYLVRLETIQEGTQFAVCIVDGRDQEGNPKYIVDEIDFTDADREFADGRKSELDSFEINQYIASFKVTDLDGNVVTKFRKGIVLYIGYSANDLKMIKERGFNPPRAAALVLDGYPAKENWVELGGTFREFAPEELPYPGFERLLEIFYWELPDPLIGGC